MSEETVTQDAEHSENAGVGPLLRASRQRVGEDLRDVAELLRIRYPYLEAIEEGRFKIEVEAGGARHDLHFPTPVAETGFPGGAIVFVGLVVAVLAYGGWYLSTTKDGFFSDLVAPLPERLAALVDGKSTETTEPVQPAMANLGENASAHEETATPPPEPKPEPGTEATDRPAAEAGAEPGTATPAETASPAPEPDAQAQEAAARAEAAAAEAARAEAEAAAAKAREAAEEAARKEAAEKAAQEAAEKAAQEAAQEAAEKAAQEAARKAAQEAARKAEALARAQAEAEAEARAVSEAAAQADTQAVEIQTLPPPAPPAPVAEASTPQPAESAGTEAPQPAPPAAEAETRIVVYATANSWIEVRDDFSNTMLFSRLLKAGESYAVPDKTGLSLHTGNAGALEIRVDGNPVPPIGAGGAVLRGVQLDPELLKSGSAAQ